jgi:hypothetical protein
MTIARDDVGRARYYDVFRALARGMSKIEQCNQRPFGMSTR